MYILRMPVHELGNWLITESTPWMNADDIFLLPVAKSSK